MVPIMDSQKRYACVVHECCHAITALSLGYNVRIKIHDEPDDRGAVGNILWGGDDNPVEHKLMVTFSPALFDILNDDVGQESTDCNKFDLANIRSLLSDKSEEESVKMLEEAAEKIVVILEEHDRDLKCLVHDVESGMEVFTPEYL